MASSGRGIPGWLALIVGPVAGVVIGLIGVGRNRADGNPVGFVVMAAVLGLVGGVLVFFIDLIRGRGFSVADDEDRLVRKKKRKTRR